VDRPFWKDKDPETGRDLMSMKLTDRLTRGTYLFDNGDDKPGVICLSYSWMSDALKMLPQPIEKRVKLALDALKKIYPKVDIAARIIGDPITVSWEADPHFLGAFKGALPGHYRYNQRMYAHFMQQDMPSEQRGMFIAGDDVSWTPAWVEGAVQTSLNAVWGIMTHFGGKTHAANPGPGDVFHEIGPIALADRTGGMKPCTSRSINARRCRWISTATCNAWIFRPGRPRARAPICWSARKCSSPATTSAPRRPAHSRSLAMASR